MMYSDQLKHIAYKNIPNFIGVFSIDNIPSNIQQSSTFHFIVNNQTSNLPGQHWLGVSVMAHTAHIFDPLGLPPPRLLVYNLKRKLGIRHVSYNKRQEQQVWEQNCGPRVIAHLSKTSK